MRLTDFIILCTVLYCELLSFVRSHSTLEEAQQINHSPAKKYKKKLRKEDGAIRLVGGLNDYEGEQLFFWGFFLLQHSREFDESFKKHLKLFLVFKRAKSQKANLNFMMRFAFKIYFLLSSSHETKESKS